MEHTMLWGALALGVAGWLCLLLLALRGPSSDSETSSSNRRNIGPFEGIALLLPVVVWLATLPTKAPFSSGQGWGRGFLLGGLMAALSCLVVLSFGKTANRGRHFALTAMFGAIIVACVPLLWMRHSVIEALLGASLGWCVVSLLWLYNSTSGGATRQNDTSTTALGLLNGAAFATTLCGAAALGVYRDFLFADVARGTYPAVALVIATGIALVLLFGTLLDEALTHNPAPPATARTLQAFTVFLGIVVPLGLSFLLATRFLDELKLVYCVGVGAVLSLLGWGLLWESSQQEMDRHTASTTVPPVAIVVTLCAFMLTYSFLQGFGVGLMILAAWPVSLLIWPSVSAEEKESEGRLRLDVRQVVTLLGSFLAVLLLSRVFATRFRADLRGVGFSDQFALFGFLAGAMVPTWLAALYVGNKGRVSAAVPPLLRCLGVGVLALLLPSGILAIWGIKVMPAFFAGLALSLVGWGALSSSAKRACAIALFAQAVALVITQWTLRFLPLAEASRAQRLHFLLWGLGSAILLVLVIDVGARWLAQRGQRRLVGQEPTPGVSP